MTPARPQLPEGRRHSAPVRLIWRMAGLVALALALLGAVLPVMPTTVFVLIAVYCFARGAPEWAGRLERHRVWGPIIADWRAHGAIAPRYKAIAVAMMALALGLSLAVGVRPWVLGVQALCIAAAAGYVLSRPNGPQVGAGPRREP